MSIKEAYELALKREPMIRAQLQIQSSNSRYDAIKGAALPQINLKADYSRLDDTRVTSSTFSKDPHNVSLELTQSLFRGGREYAELRKGKIQIDSSEWESQKTQFDLLNELVKSFVEVQYYEEELKLRTEIQKLSQDRVNFLKERVRIGRSRKSELVSAEAQLASAESDLDEAKTLLLTSREQLSFLTGKEVGTKITPIPYQIKLKNIDHYLSKISSSPNLQFEKLKVELIKEDLNIAKSGHWPSLDLKGNYYLHRNGSNSQSDWAVTLSLTLPLFESGKTSSNIDQAAFTLSSAESSFRYINQQLERDVRTLYDSLFLSENQVQSFSKSVELNRQNYQIQLREYGLGLVNNLEVLQTLGQYNQSRSRLNAERIKNYYRLLSLLGDSTEIN
ncbi:MAG: hypothetical protein OHK0056_31900 [Bacteriovoracaceae bacterium]